MVISDICLRIGSEEAACAAVRHGQGEEVGLEHTKLNSIHVLHEVMSLVRLTVQS